MRVSDVSAIARNALTLEIGDEMRSAPQPLPVLQLCFPLIRANRLDWLIEKAVECGVDVLRPTVFEHSVRGEAPSANRTDRWQRIVVEASEQCGRLYLPSITEPVAYGDVVDRAENLVVADPSGESESKVAAKMLRASSITLVIGPEGGLSAAELEVSRSKGASVISLGANILRAETAAIVAISRIRAWSAEQTV